jgi:hypothetical protein
MNCGVERTYHDNGILKSEYFEFVNDTCLNKTIVKYIVSTQGKNVYTL